MQVIRSFLRDGCFCSVSPGMPGFLRNTDHPWYATSAFRSVMLRCCVHSLPVVAFVLGITCRSPTDVGNLTALVRMVNHVATLYVGVCYERDPTTLRVIIDTLWLLNQVLPLSLLVRDLPSSLMIHLLRVYPTYPEIARVVVIAGLMWMLLWR